MSLSLHVTGKEWSATPRLGKTAAVDVELRAVTEAEYPTFSRNLANAFGFFVSDDDITEHRHQTELDRTIGAFEGSELVGTAGAFSFELTVPGAAPNPTTVPTAGVTMVSVRATHRRRGLLTQIMQYQLDDVAARGEPVAVLTASEGGIYDRFGYGLATFSSWWHVRTDTLEFARPPETDGRMRFVSLDDARPVVADLYERVRRRRVGEVTRSAGVWDNVFADRQHRRRGASQLFAVVHESETGAADGYVLYRMRSSWEQNHADNTLLVQELEALDDEVEAALWHFVVNVDLVTTVRSGDRPVDDVLRWRLVDPRRLHIDHVNDHLWVRIVDPAAALAARGYAVDDELVLELTDRFLPQNDGRWLVTVSGGGARVTGTARAPDLALGASELGSMYLGGVAPSSLARAGRVHELADGALARADRLFATSPIPWCATHF
jgi:predicted acetyltransferase